MKARAPLTTRDPRPARWGGASWRSLAAALIGIALAVLLAAGPSGCADGAGEQLVEAGQRPPVLLVAGRPVTVELALTEQQRSRGLKHRTHLDEAAGMLFVFPDEDTRNFWMKDTLIPLDIVFLDSEGVVLNVATAQPAVEKPGYSSLGRPARMVLELNAGWCARHGLKPGDHIPVAAEILARGK